MATVLNNVFPWGMYYGGDTAPNGAWGIIDEVDRRQVHITSSPATPNVAHTFTTPARRLVHDGARWIALVDTVSGGQCYRAADGMAGASFSAVGAELDPAIDFLGAGGGALFSHDLRDGAISRSTDGGATWSVVINAARLTADGFIDTAFRPERFSGGDGASWIYAPSQSNDFPPLIYASTDSGAAWSLINGPLLDAGQPDYGYAVSDLAVLNGVIYLNGYRYFTADYRIYKSDDLGATWIDVSLAIPTPANSFDLMVAKQGFVYLFSRYGATMEHVEVRRVSSAGVQAFLEPLLDIGFPYLLRQSVLISTDSVAFGNGGSIDDTKTVLFDLPSLGEAVEFLSAVATASDLAEFEMTHLQFISSALVASSTAPQGAVSTQFVSSTSVASLLASAQYEAASLASSVTTAGALSGAAVFGVSLNSYALLTFAVPGDDDAHDTWVLNLDAGGLTRYEGFDFNSFAKIGDGYYGCKVDGIYRLDGDTDAGEPIRSMVSFGKQNFGTSALKRITNAYIGVSGRGRLFLRVMAEGQEYTYAARSYDERLQVQRIDTGKGLRVNWLEFELYNADGEDFELASVEFAVVPLSRRI